MIAHVWGVGARGPLGLSSVQVATMVRARRLEPRDVALEDRRGRAIGVALTGGLGEHVTGYERLLGLAAPALAEACDGAFPRAGGIPLFVCLPEAGRADDDPRFEGEFVQALGDRSGVALDLGRSRTFRFGHAGFATALAAAKALLDGGASAVLVGGVDSYYHAGVLRALDAAYRLHAMGSEDGFIPSEGAAFLLLARETQGTGRRGAILASEAGDEVTMRDESLPNLADAMTELVQRTLPLLGDRARVITDENGESHRQSEWEKVSLRLLGSSERLTWVWDTGDVGAATGPLFAAMVLELRRLGALDEARILLALHSDGGARGAVVLEGVS